MTGARANGWAWLGWLYLRISAVLLLGLVLGHLYIMHVLNSTDRIDFAFVAQRFSTPFWRVYDLLILLLALTHGLVGVRGIVYDYTRSAGWRLVWNVVLWSVGLVFTILGSLVLFSFQPGTLIGR
ncbi:MAG: succinate dehydrogenase, hydrophobic membrane anchor protein [Armatimonadota bacterium]|nr:succinate dehydrogenase, hydrophobic membrane anchor protein [Armatimonadota bacterium]MDR7440391.1 succinate dehydrogenase, hydrophobic membrane anchor protein [Armatimonadota bacterium]MDR7443431.1 succinate dehydrogenase, hydrophobic membrane anchor protein [Armatimonadota bacterium]MDR7569270.1 succinate dehydrogenase, hydrophobic membrane anchor protein [Armatimonadota bacterium]MDR7614930.1 succinate dehydrogenase, hydrophobic membrane anchor protein [Armatimonadota bacterium]